MKIKDLLDLLPLKVVVNGDLEREITGGCVSDLLSHVMARGKDGNVWITIQSHQNIVAVASLLNFSAIIVAGGVEIDDKTIEKAKKEGINILTIDEDIYQVAGKLYSLGI
ncbi:serine kinase [Anoxybacter fermentans]|uniref:Serine kinase n=1 Tax=Anoxybacter fermentans TaxID=1323375 RepID=A0A3S9SYC6_9FIRM|nr:DRTGG domain-containing protein [Anoxybacter fermentans]AZR73309.1 serine kinase [Anoxybacter fermentans]